MNEFRRIGNTLQLTAGNKAQYGCSEGGPFTIVRQGNGLIQYVRQNLQPQLRFRKAAADANILDRTEFFERYHDAV